MLKWKTFGVDDNPLNGISKLIIERLGAVSKTYFSYKKKQDSRRTRLIYKQLTLLGDKQLEGKPHYRVMSHRLPKQMTQGHGGRFKNVEWLYDLHWYSEVEPTCYKQLSMPLAVECEWGWKRKGEKKRKGNEKDPYGSVKYDFQKLLVTNADLKLMIFRVADETRRSDLDKYFEDAVNNYGKLPDGSQFLFIAFEEKTKTLNYAYMQSEHGTGETLGGGI